MKNRWFYRRQPDYDLNPHIPQPPVSLPSESVPLPSLSERASHYVKPRKSRLLWLGMAVLAAGVLGVGVWRWTVYRNSPAVIFGDALSNALHTQQVKQFWHTGTDASSVIFDLRNTKKPRTTTIITKSFGADTYVKGYGTMQNTYLAYASNPQSQSATPTELLDRWISLRTGGKLPAQSEANSMIARVDPRFQLFGPWLFGNFSQAERSELIKLAESRQLYTFDAQQVQPMQRGDQMLLVYQVKVSSAMLANYNYRAAAFFGVPRHEAERALEPFKDTQQVKFYIDADLRQLVRLEGTSNGIAYTMDYGDHTGDAAGVGTEPGADLTYPQYLELLSALPS